jgi:F-box-like
MSLPTEILQEIILQLNQATLAKCTQVSSQFRALSIPVLYESPSLLTADRFRRFSRELSVDNAVYVHTLDLSMTARRWDSIKGQEIVELLLKCLYITHLDLDMCMAL